MIRIRIIYFGPSSWCRRTAEAPFTKRSQFFPEKSEIVRFIYGSASHPAELAALAMLRSGLEL